MTLIDLASPAKFLSLTARLLPWLVAATAISTTLIGRSQPLRQLRGLATAYRVVTLTGPGGIGKTVLAMEAARGLVADFQDGGWLVELASLSDPSLLPLAVAGVGETNGFMKILADPATKQILGAAILGTGGDEAIHGILDALNAKVPYDTLRWAVPIHPTVSELIPTVLGDLRPVAAA